VSLPTIHVLLATHNGERFLSQQWNSIAAQQGVRVVLHVGDDGSTDGTPQLLQSLAAAPGGAIAEVHWLQAPPRRSAARNFLALLADAVQCRPEARWFAFCDQDDIWLPGKLQAALAVLGRHGNDTRAALYGGRTIAVDEQDREGGLSPLFQRTPSFRNAIAQSIMGGNTMVLNRASALLLTDGALPEVVSHDWWSYQLVSGAGGFVHYDPVPFVRYRQHANNAVGSNLGWRARMFRLARLLRGDFRGWNDLHMRALQDRAAVLTDENREVLQAFVLARQAWLPWQRAAWLRRSGVFRQTRGEQLMLWVACLLRRM
jgi:glycosyltransferase involved in cell wall biosynthesis